MANKAKLQKDIDWGGSTFDWYNESQKEAGFIFNLCFRDERSIKLGLNYAVGRTFYAASHLPEEIRIRLIFDIRGQDVIMSRSKNIKDMLVTLLTNLQLSNRTLIEFVR